MPSPTFQVSGSFVINKLILIILIVCWCGAEGSAERTAPGAVSSAVDFAGVTTKYCGSCHNARVRAGELDLGGFDAAQLHRGVGSEVGEKIVRRLRTGMMPPQGMPQPDDETRRQLVTWLEGELDRAEREKPNPGRPLLRRLNRAEYGNAVRDLLALDVDVTTLVPPDNSAYGFDNIAEVLGVSPTLQERYLSAADTLSALAVGDRTLPADERTFTIRQDVSQNQHIDGLPLGTLGGARIRYTFPLDGEYELQVKLYRSNLGMMRGLEHEHPFEISVDGVLVHAASIGGPADLAAAFETPTDAGDVIDARLSVRAPITAGTRDVVVAFAETAAPLDTMRLRPFTKSAHDTLDWTGRPHIQSLTIRGPFNPKERRRGVPVDAAGGVGETPSQRRVFTCHPSTRAEESACARQIVSTLLRRAYRQPVAAADLRRAMSIYDAGRREGTFEDGIQRAIQFVLASPRFVFRSEHEPAGVPAGSVYRISDLDLASQLSFFLWSSLPDDELLNAATKGTLSTPAVADEQVRRMLADSRSRALVTNFAGQWLQLRNIRNVQPNSDDFPDFDDNLRTAFQRETELLIESIIAEDRSVLDVLAADYTYVNERLAKHYGIPRVYGSHFRRVQVTNEARRGILGHGGILALTSHATRTSPVQRGKWILENIVGTPPPPPPPDVPTLKEREKGEKPRSMREQLAQHRADPTCASCHKIMDPIGFAMENFDAVGAWRTRDGGVAIDASGVLADGAKVDGVVALRAALLRRPQVFVTTLTEKLMVYALGRGLTYHDMPAVRAIVRDAERDGYRFSSLVRAVINSTPFRFRMTPAEHGTRNLE